MMPDVVMAIFHLEASNIVGDNGSVYALDVYPESIETVKKEIKTRNLVNIETTSGNTKRSLVYCRWPAA